MFEKENVVVVQFTEPSKAYQALSVLKECDAEGRIALQSAAIVERTPEGELRIPEGRRQCRSRRNGERLADRDARRRPGRAGRCSGRLGSGRLDGRSVRPRSGREAPDEVLAALGRAMPPESTAVIATVAEPAVEAIDGDMAKSLGGGDLPS